MKVIIGLGNPGPKYAGTRHNIGCAVIDYLASAPGVGGFRKKFESQVADFTEGAEQVLLVKPETFMNLSGRAVRQIVDFYKIALTDILVICDDLALPLGKLRLRAKGSDGGQKGLRSIEEQLGTAEYLRLRIGIDSPSEHEDAVDYVLSRFRPGERAAIDEAIAQAAQGVLLWVREGLEKTMNRVNAGPEKEKSKEKTKKKEGGKPAAGSDSTATDH